MYIVQTTANYPDVALYGIDGNEVLLHTIFCGYVFMMGFIVMNVLVAIFYSNYKAYFAEIISGLDYQNSLCRILACGMSSNGNIRMGIVKDLVNKLHECKDPNYPVELDEAIKAYNQKLKHKKLKKLIAQKKEEQRKRKGLGVREDQEEQVNEIPTEKRPIGYNQKHMEKFKKIKKHWLYILFFCALNLYIAMKPIWIIETRRDYFEFNPYAMVDICCIITLTDPLLVYVFEGSKKLMKWLYKIEIGTTVTIIIMGFCLSFYGSKSAGTENDEDFVEKSLEKNNAVFFGVYAAFCLAKINRLFFTVIRRLPQVKCVINVFVNMRPFVGNLISMIGITFLIFGQIGIHLFGGKINSETPNVYTTVGTGSFGTKYEHQTFNDFPNAFVMMWDLFVNNCWPTMTYQSIVQDDSPLCIAYFICFIVIGIIVILNVVVGFIIDVILAYLQQKSGDISLMDLNVLEDLAADVIDADYQKDFAF